MAERQNRCLIRDPDPQHGQQRCHWNLSLHSRQDRNR
jgi:hypothetical protein